MQTKSTILVALFAFATSKLVAAAPPACLLAAVNTQPNPADLAAICGENAGDMQSEIESLCGGRMEEAMNAYEKVCAGSGYEVSTNSTSASSTRSAGPMSTGSSNHSEIVVYTSTYYDSDCKCSKTTAVSTYATMAPGSASPTGVSPGGHIGNTTVASSPRPTGTAPEAQVSASLSGAAARYVAGPFAGVAILAAGFVVAM